MPIQKIYQDKRLPVGTMVAEDVVTPLVTSRDDTRPKIPVKPNVSKLIADYENRDEKAKETLIVEIKEMIDELQEEEAEKKVIEDRTKSKVKTSTRGTQTKSVVTNDRGTITRFTVNDFKSFDEAIRSKAIDLERGCLKDWEYACRQNKPMLIVASTAVLSVLVVMATVLILFYR